MVENSTENNSVASSAPVETHSAPAPSAPTVDNSAKQFTQDDLDRVVGRVRAEERSKRDSVANTQSMGGMQAPSLEDVQKIINESLAKKEEEFQQRNWQAQAHKTAEEFMGKVNPLIEGNEEISGKYVESVFANAPHVAWMTNQLSNAGHVAIELAKSPAKLAQLQVTFEKLGHEALKKELSDLSNSIQINQQAANVKVANDPLKPIQPSTSSLGTDDGLTRSVSDFARRYRN